VAETGADPSMAIKKLKTRGFGSGSPASALVLSLTRSGPILYNVMYHLAEYNADWGSDNLALPRIPGRLLIDLFITLVEEGLMGINETLIEDWREENQIPDTDGIEEILEDLKRARAEKSVSVAGRPRKLQRR